MSDLQQSAPNGDFGKGSAPESSASCSRQESKDGERTAWWQAPPDPAQRSEAFPPPPQGVPWQGASWGSGTRQPQGAAFGSGYDSSPPSPDAQQSSVDSRSSFGLSQGPYASGAYAPPIVTKDHVAAGLLAIFLGVFGVHKFYLGYNTAGFIMMAITIVGSVFTIGLAGGTMFVIAVIEGVIYLTKSQSEFDATYVVRKKEWF